MVLLLFVPLQGQAVAGRVVDAVTGEPLRDANVILEGTTLGDAADGDGRFVIDGGSCRRLCPSCHYGRVQT